MFEDFFTIYSMVEPPETIKTLIPDVLTLSTNFFPMEQVVLKLSASNNKLNRESYRFVYPEQDIEEQVTHSTNDSKVVLKGSALFEKALLEAIKINPEVSNYRNFLVKTAKLESGFNSYIQNRAGAPYYGYFQMGIEAIKRTTGLTLELFRNDPVQQILGAVKLYLINLKTVKAIGVYDLCKEKGYTDDAIVAGAWAGGPGGVKKFIKGLGDPSDSHWYNGKGGTSVGSRMKEFNKYE